jgi:hypothetical protein
MSKFRLKPHKAKAHMGRHGDEAWWYESATGIDIYVRTLDGATNGSMTLSCSISKRALAGYMKRAES